MFVKRPVALTALSFTAAFCVFAGTGAVSGVTLLMISSALFALSFVCSFALRGRYRLASRYVACVAAGIVAASVFAVAVYEPSLSEYAHLKGTTAKIEGEVGEKLWSSHSGSCYSLDVSFVDGEKESFTVALIADKSLDSGDTVSAKCRFSGAKGLSSGYGKNYYTSKGITLTADSDYVIVTGRSSSLSVKIRELNGMLSEKLRSGMSEESGAVADAVLLGNRGGIGDAARRDFSRIGISHLLAISGMHVSFIALAVMWFFKKIRVGKKAVSVIVILTMIFYMFLTGFTPSVVRASVVCCIMALVGIVGKSYDGMTALSLCGVGMILVDPYAASDPAMVLSFTACIGCFAASSLMKKLGLSDNVKGKRNMIRSALRASLKTLIFTLTVVMFTLPVMLLYFDEVSLVSPIANIVFIPLFSLILYISAAALIFSPIAPVFAGLSFAADKLISFALRLSRGAAPIRGITVSLKYPFSPYIAAAISVCVILLVAVGKKRVKFAALGAAFFIAVYAVGSVAYKSGFDGRVTFVRTGGEKSDVFTVSSGGKTLIFGSSDYGYPSYESGIDAARDMCITEFDALAVADYSKASYSSVSELTDKVYIRTAYLAPSANSPEWYVKMKDLLTEKGIEVKDLDTAPGSLTIGEAGVTFVGGKNGGAPCFRVDGGNSSVGVFGENWKTQNSGGSDIIGDCTYIVFGSAGNSKSHDYGTANDFGDCRKFAFADRAYFAGIPGAEFPDPYSPFVLNLG